jgi:DNA-binding GntR family transcriptional regulator
VADSFGVSRLPVREALRVLVAEGLAEQLPSRGLAVAAIASEAVEDILDVRDVLEELASHRAAQRIREGVDAGRLTQLVAEVDSAIADARVEDAFRANGAFHDEILRLAANPVLDAAMKPVASRLHWQSGDRVDLCQVALEHRELLSAILSGDEERVRAETRRHMGHFRARVLAHLRLSSARPTS